MYRGGNNDRRVADEASVTLMELENNQRWVIIILYRRISSS